MDGAVHPGDAFAGAATPSWEVLNRLPVGVCLLDSHRRFVTCNDRYRQMLGGIAELLQPGTPFEDVVCAGVSRGLVVGGEGGSPASWLRRRITAHRNGRVQMEVRFADGVEARIEELTLADGGRLVTLTDVTVLKQQERALAARIADLEDMQLRMESQSAQLAEFAERLASMRDEAERANRTKSEFLANMSHELRSPLNAVIGFAEIMKDELFGALGNGQYREYAYDIWSSGRHLLDLINDILDLSKIEAGKLELVESRFDLGQTIDTCIRLVAGRAQKHEVSVRPTLSGNGITLWADERKLKQVLINLLTNAIKFTKPGGRVTVAVTRQPDGRIKIAVADTGIGIDAADIPKALAAFGQVESTLSRKQEGTGLGLPLSKALAELHGGSLEIVSEVGAGTTVSVVLPAHRVVQRLASPAAA